MASPGARLQLRPLDISPLSEAIPVGDGLTLGRDPSNRVVLPAELFPHVSAHHARISVRDEETIIEDLGSKNGTLVNGQEVRQATLHPGDVVQLGRKVGPRFAAVVEGSLHETVTIAPDTVRPGDTLSRASISRLREAIGDRKTLDDAVRKQNRRLISLTLTLLGLGLAIGFVLWSAQRKEGIQILELQELNEKLARRLEETNRDVSRQQNTWTEQLNTLERERDTLLGQLSRLEERTIASSREREQLQEQLAQTGTRLELLKPLSLEQLEEQRRKVLEQTLRSVVFIEKKVFLRDSKAGELLYIEEIGPGTTGANFERRGEPFHEESGGSGFCVSPDGWIITNAHVVTAPGTDEALTLDEREIVPEMQLAVVFSGTGKRHKATVHRRAEENENDVALLKIEPFEGLPYLEVRLDATPPPPGKEIRLLGFPFGKNIPQEGDTMRASVFGGVASRKVGQFLQVHAAVYPGNSGGPVLDTGGTVLGVVTSVQTLKSGQISEIGYVLPIARVAEVWPEEL